YFQWGLNAERQSIQDRLNEWEYQDSSGYSLPYVPGALSLYSALRSHANLEITRLTGYVQDNIVFDDSSGFTMQAGIRYNYNTLNSQLLIAPRLSVSWTPFHWKKDIIFRGAAGIYDQPPFYREL